MGHRTSVQQKMDHERKKVENHYSRVRNLRKIVLSHELAPVPTSMFESSGEMRITTSKSFLKRQLQVEVSTRTTVSKCTPVFVIDGSTLGNSVAG